MIIVNPNNRRHDSVEGIEPPLWAGLIASYHKANIIDAEGLDLSLEETERAVRDWGDKDVLIVVMGNNPSVSSTPKMSVAERLASRISDLNVSMTGIHPIACGSKYPVISKPFEGFPDMPFGLLPMDRYRAHNWHCLDGSPRSPYASVYTSLGCPFDCYYCNIHTLYGDMKVRFRPLDKILKEVDLLSGYKVRNIKFWDELFALNEDRVIDICEGIKGYHLNAWAYARVDTMTGNMLKAMKDGGITWLAYGFESADMVVRKKSNKKFTDSQAERAIKMTKEAGINIIANLMLGLPGETDESMTLDWAKSHLFEYVNIYVARPYPGSKWYNDSRPSDKWEDYNQHSGRCWSSRKQALKDYFSNPAYLEMIEKKLGVGAVTHIREII